MNSNKDNSKLNNFLVQGGILAMAGIFVRILGLAKRIPLPYIIGDVGSSYYSAAYEIYNIVYVVSAYGIPLSVSKLVSAKISKGEYRNADKIFKSALLVAVIIGLFTSSFVFIFSDFLSRLLHEPMSFMAVRTLAPLLFIVSVMGVFRGFFQGMGTMIPTAISQLIEQIVVISVGLICAYFFGRYGEKVGMILHNENYKYAYGAAGATLGCTVGSLVGLIFLILVYKSNQKSFSKKIYRDPSHKVDSTGYVIKTFLLTVLPVILSNFVNYVSNIIDMGIHNAFMEKKNLYDIKSVNWGIYSGKYLVLINIPVAISAAMGASSVPTISSLMKRKEIDEVKIKIEKVIRVTMMISIPCAAGLFALAPSLMYLLFSTTNPISYNLLRIGAVGVITFSFMTLTTGILQGMSKLSKPIIHGLIALALHVTLLIILLNFTNLNIYAVALSNNFFSLFIGLMNITSICKIINYKQESKRTFILPAISSIVMGVAIYFIDKLFTKSGPNKILTFVSIIVGGAIYFVIMLLTKAIKKDEILMLPFGKKIYSILNRLHLI